MGWTWGSSATPDMLQLYPSLANIPVLLDRWPGLRELVEHQQAADAARPVPDALSPPSVAPTPPTA